MIRIDGKTGEGGGQILRSALTLSLATGQSFEIDSIRAGRSKPGLLRQHLACVKAAAEIGGASTVGAELGSTRLAFTPGAVRAGDYRFAIGSAGSTMLVLQTVLVPLLFANAPSTVRVEGGTHNSAAPPFEFFERVFLPTLARMGVRVTATLERAGFHPAGGGKAVVHIEPGPLSSFTAVQRGDVRALVPRVVLANLPSSIAEREASTLASELHVERREVRVERPAADGPGNIVSVDIECESAREIVTAFGERGVKAEDVARNVARQARRFVDANVPVGEHLADQLLLPMALGGGGSFSSVAASDHLHTNAWLIGLFLGEGAVQIVAGEGDRCFVTVRPRA